MSSPIRVATAVLSNRIFAGRPTKDGKGLKEPSYDVTSDVLVAIRDKIGIGNEIEVGLAGTGCMFRIAVLPPFVPALPTTNDAIPAGMVRWDGGDRAPDDWDGGPVLFRNETLQSGAGSSWSHPWAAGVDGEPIVPGATTPYDIIAYTPKPSPTPKGGLPGRGEAQWRIDMDAAKHGRPVVLNSDSPLWRYPFVGFWNAATGWWDFSDPNLSGCFAVSELVNQWAPLPNALAPAEAIRDGGEGGESA